MLRIFYFGKRGIFNVLGFLLLGIFTFLTGYGLVMDNIATVSKSKYEAIYQGDSNKKEIALTCNVVWGEEFVPEILKILKDNEVKITFYMGGKFVEQFPELTKEIADGKHEIGNHGYSHPYPTRISYGKNVDEILKTQEAIYKVTGIKTNLFAPPYGEYNQTVLEAAGEHGYKTIIFSMDTIDWQRPAPQVLVQRVMKKAHNGGIVLMHPTAPTVKALPSIIKELRGKGYKLVTVGELLEGK